METANRLHRARRDGPRDSLKLAESGYELAVYNRTRAKSEEVGSLGAQVADSPADAAREADVVMLSLADQHIVESMLYGDDGVVGSAPQGAHIVDLSTVPAGLLARDRGEGRGGGLQGARRVRARQSAARAPGRCA